MNDFKPLIICHEQIQHFENTGVKFDFIPEKLDSFGFNSEQMLNHLIFEILKKPHRLAVHLERIYFCYQHNLFDELFAGLVDFLIVLEGKGRSLASRIVQGAKSKLLPYQYAILSDGLNRSAESVKLLQGNVHSLFSAGLVGTNVLIIKKDSVDRQEHDPLDLARDFVAYSQLDEAMDMLENAILINPDRQVLQDDLLELYQVTHNVERFKKMYDVLSGQTKTMPVGWDELKGFFNEG